MSKLFLVLKVLALDIIFLFAIYGLSYVIASSFASEVYLYQLFLCTLLGRLLEPIMFREKYFWIYFRVFNDDN